MTKSSVVKWGKHSVSHPCGWVFKSRRGHTYANFGEDKVVAAFLLRGNGAEISATIMKLTIRKVTGVKTWHSSGSTTFTGYRTTFSSARSNTQNTFFHDGGYSLRGGLDELTLDTVGTRRRRNSSGVGQFGGLFVFGGFFAGETSKGRILSIHLKNESHGKQKSGCHWQHKWDEVSNENWHWGHVISNKFTFPEPEVG